ncbi:MAG: hypothetical protein WCA82_01310 [Jiangellales bacterium]
MARLNWAKASRRGRDRRARLVEVADQALLGRVIRLKYPGACGVCGQRLPVGAKARWSPDGWIEHVDCAANFLEELPNA